MKKIKFKNEKFNLEVFEIAKLSNMQSIYGGTGANGDTNTGGDKDQSSLKCLTVKPKNPVPTDQGPQDPNNDTKQTSKNC